MGRSSHRFSVGFFIGIGSGFSIGYTTFSTGSGFSIGYIGDGLKPVSRAFHRYGGHYHGDNLCGIP